MSVNEESVRDLSAVELGFELRYARAVNEISKVIARDKPERIREAMVKIIGETLDVDRTLIYDIDFKNQLVRGLSEWLNPAVPGITPTIATYPMAVFVGGCNHVRETREFIVSHSDDVHPALVDDGSGKILHEAMCIESLLWLPFDFDEEHFLVLVFNQVRAKRTWSEADLGFSSDVAELVSLAQLRLRIEAQRLQEREVVEQRSRLEGLGLLAGGVAHDFNNLLTVILGTAELIGESLSDDSAAQEQVGTITRASMTAASMCRQLLTYSGHFQPELERLDLNVLLRETATLVDGLTARNFSLEACQEPLWVMGDVGQLQGLVLNLLTNAVQALEQGGSVTVRTGWMTRAQAGKRLSWNSTGMSDEVRAYFEVEDTGVGMSKETKARIFEPFFTTKGTGHGLGMATAHGVLAGHGVSFGLCSEEGQGTTFTILLPTEQSIVSNRQPGDKSEHHSASTALSILVVDDEPMITSVCESTLTLAGYAATTANSGEKALTACAEAASPFDAAVVDVGLPGIDGCQTLLAMRKGGHDFPVVLISGHPLGGGRSMSELDDGDWLFLRKPFSPRVLLKCIEKMTE